MGIDIVVIDDALEAVAVFLRVDTSETETETNQEVVRLKVGDLPVVPAEDVLLSVGDWLTASDNVRALFSSLYPMKFRYSSTSPSEVIGSSNTARGNSICRHSWIALA